jgi:serine protease AprX
MKKYIISIFVLVLIAVAALSFRNTGEKFGPHLISVLDNKTENTFIVYVNFTDKGPNAGSRLSNPLSLVTQRSIDRRLKVKSPNEVVEMTDVPLYDPYVQMVASKVINVRQQLKWFNALTVEATKEQLEEISNLSFVDKIDLVERYFRNPNNIENKVEKNILSEPKPKGDNIEVDSLNYGTNGSTQITQMNVNVVHNQGIFGQGILICSQDDGFRNQTHPAFTNPVNPLVLESQYDFELHIPNASHTETHGTTTISCIGAYAPGQLIGTAFKSHFLAARTEVDSIERPREMDNWTAASQWADSLGADVITSSLGYLVFDAGYGGYTWQDMNGLTMLVTRSAAIAARNGILVFNSAGNNGPGSVNTLNGPADADSIVTMGAVEPNGIVTSFSSVGPTTSNPVRIKPDVMAMGDGVQTANGNNNGYSGGGSAGTSYSCPLAAGVGALILSANKSLTPLQVRGILRKFASRSNTPGNTYGWGIINAALSVDSARKLDNTPPTILHTQPFTTTLNTGVITMKAKIFDNGIIRLWPNQAPLLYYRTSTNGGTTWSATTPVNYNALSLDTFFFPIPGNPLGTTVQYYFAAQDIALPNPLLSTLPAGGSGINPPGTTAPPTRFQYYIGVNGITPISSEIPNSFKLYNNYPNPFNPSTKIKFDIPAAGLDNNQFVKIRVYDLLGREVITLVNDQLKPGRYEISFDASKYSSGVYFYKLETTDFTDIKKMILLK